MPSMSLGASAGMSSAPSIIGFGFALNGFKTGCLQGNTSAERMPDVPCNALNVMAPATNGGQVWIGPNTSVTAEAGADSLTVGWELSAQQQLGWMAFPNLNYLSFISENATDDLIWMVI